MKIVRLTEPQASFVEIEILGRYAHDDDDYIRDVVDAAFDAFDRSGGRVLAVSDEDAMRNLLLDVINGIDDEMDAYRKGDQRALGRIGVDTLGQALGLYRTGESLIKRLR